jgi:hypothetical protein
VLVELAIDRTDGRQAAEANGEFFQLEQRHNGCRSW